MKKQITAISPGIAGSTKTLTTAAVGENPAEWIRPAAVPKIFGMSRATVYRLMGSGKIRSTLLRVEGNVSGMRLISAQSIRDLLSVEAA